MGCWSLYVSASNAMHTDVCGSTSLALGYQIVVPLTTEREKRRRDRYSEPSQREREREREREAERGRERKLELEHFNTQE